MFYERFLELCKMHNVTPTFVVESVGLSKSNATYWKGGSIPSKKNLQKLADYFEVPVEYLLGTHETITVDVRDPSEVQETISDVQIEKDMVLLKNLLNEIDTIPKKYKAEAIHDITTFVQFTLSRYKTMVPADSFIGP